MLLTFKFSIMNKKAYQYKKFHHFLGRCINPTELHSSLAYTMNSCSLTNQSVNDI